MATTGVSAPASPSDVGRHLRAVRKAQGLSRAEVARSAGLTRRELAAYERGRTPVPDSDLWCLAGSCGVDVNELLPPRDRLGVSSDLGALTVGETVRRLRPGSDRDGILREYLAMLYELRNLPPGTRPPMRDEDLASLADALGGTPDAIEARLHQLIGASREEAARLRSVILAPRPLAAAPAAPLPPLASPVTTGAPLVTVPPAPGMAGVPAMVAMAGAPGTSPMAPPAYPPPTFEFATAPSTIGNPLAADRFFEGPRVDDPFAPPPPLDPLSSLDGLGPLDGLGLGGGPAGPSFDPFAPPAMSPLVTFPPPTGPPLEPPSSGAVRDAAGSSPFDDPFAVPAVTPGGTLDPAPGPHPPPAPGTDLPVDVGLDLPGEPFVVEATAWSDDAPFGGLDVVALDGLEAPDHLVVGADGSNGRGDAATGDGELGVLAFPDASTAPDRTEGLDGNRGIDEIDDPFAALRVPLSPEDDGSPSDSGLVVDWPLLADVDPGPVWAVEPDDAAVSGDVADDPALATTLADEVVDPVADLHPDPPAPQPVSLAGGHDPEEEPSDEWFDRAAAAAEALVAEQRPVAADDPVTPETTGTADSVLPADPLCTPDAGTTEARVDETPPPLAPISWSATALGGAPGAVPTPPPDLPPEAFVAAGTAWQVGGIFPATAMADDGTLALRRADVRWALADLEATDDFTARAFVTFTSGAGFGLLFRVSADDADRITGYSFDVDLVHAGGGFLLRQWNDGRQHWQPLAHAPVADTSRLHGMHTIEVCLHADQLVATVDGETVLTVTQLSRSSIEAGCEPCRGHRLGVQAWSTTEVTVDRLMVANHPG